jgi:proteasome alpha subunit
MSMFGYVSPEQAQKDKAEFARKNIARGRPLVGASYAGGVLLCAENLSRNLHKLGEIYDRIAFAGVGKYNEFDSLRQGGIRYADSKGYQYAREDVDGRSLANSYAQTMGHIFTHEMKPLEVEILVAEVGTTQAEDHLFHVQYDGIVLDREGYAILGGDADAITERLGTSYRADADLAPALGTAVTALAGPDRTLTSNELEVAVLERAGGRRTFRRLDAATVSSLLEHPDAPDPEPEAE